MTIVRWMLSCLMGVCLVLAGGGLAWGQETVQLPIVFVHGNGDDAAKWIPTMWLFESNGYARERLFAVRMLNPLARTDDRKEQAFRSSTTDEATALGGFVTRVLLETHSAKVILVGSSRGGMTIRNYLKNGGGAHVVAAAILCGTPNHGVVSVEGSPGGEFNGKGEFLSGLNMPGPGGVETVAGVRMMTLRSDRLDKFAQPTGITSGHPEFQTGVTYAGPELQGAENVVLAGEDHRELAFSREAFRAMYGFITGHAPQGSEVVREAGARVSGLVTGFAGESPTNAPVAGVRVVVSAVGKAGETEVYRTMTLEDGRWGPFAPEAGQEYEFALESGGRRVRYFLTGLDRSTTVLNLPLLPVPASLTRVAGKRVVWVERPEGYFSRDRDPVMVDGTVSAEEPLGPLPVKDEFAVHTAGESVELFLRKERLRVFATERPEVDLAVAYFLW